MGRVPRGLGTPFCLARACSLLLPGVHTVCSSLGQMRVHGKSVRRFKHAMEIDIESRIWLSDDFFRCETLAFMVLISFRLSDAFWIPSVIRVALKHVPDDPIPLQIRDDDYAWGLDLRKLSPVSLSCPTAIYNRLSRSGYDLPCRPSHIPQQAKELLHN